MSNVRSEEAPAYNTQEEVSAISLMTAEEAKIIEDAKRVLDKLWSDRERCELLTSSAAVKLYIRTEFATSDVEVFGMILLDNRHRVIGKVELFTGTLDGASVYPREVVKCAINSDAAAVILFHNHPSGTTIPSNADKAITERLRVALGTVDIRVLDHIIVGLEGTTSFAETGLM